MSKLTQIDKRNFLGSEEAVNRLNRAPCLTAPVNAVAAAYTTSLSGSNNDMVYTAKTKGVDGNGITVRYVDPGTASATLSVSVATLAITVNLATDTGTAATLTTSLTGTNNDLLYTRKVVGTTGNSCSVTYVDPAANDQALSVTVNGQAITVNLATDGSGVITTTAAQLKAAIEANANANALVTVANAAANDGSGLVTAMSVTSLSGGANPAITSTAAQVKTAIEASTAANALVSLANAGGDNGSGTVTAMSVQTLVGGVDGTAAEAGQMTINGTDIYWTPVKSTRSDSHWLKAAGTTV